MLESIKPEFFERIKLIYTQSEISLIESAFSLSKRCTSFRLNHLLGTREEVEKSLVNAKLSFRSLPFPYDSYVLNSGDEGDLWKLDIYKEGKIYVQSIASQIPVNFLDFGFNAKILDATAAPGGKTSQLAERLNNTGEIVAVEVLKSRYEKMCYNLKKLGVTNVIPLYIDINLTRTQYPDEYFDAILFDAPCSSEGTMNIYNEKMWKDWNIANIKKNYKRQTQIAENIIPLLKQGGSMIYSTCTLAPEENEGVIHNILCHHPDIYLEEISLPLENVKYGLKSFGKYIYRKEIGKAVRIIPNDISEGFFIAKLRKQQSSGQNNIFL